MLDCRLKEHHQGNSEKGDGFILPLSLVFSDFDISPAFGFFFYYINKSDAAGHLAPLE